MRASEQPPNSFQKTVALTATGFTLGSDTRLVRFDERTGRLAITADRERCVALLAIVARGARLRADPIPHLEAAAAHWDRGDKALANLRLVFAGLPRIHEAGDAGRLRAAEYLLDHGMTPRALLRELDIDAEEVGLEKYDPNQPRVPSGQGKESGRWTDGLWDRVSHWLDDEVPVYDQDTGDEVGTRSRAIAIATNPLTIIGVGAAVLAGAEAAAAAGTATAAAELASITATAVTDATVATAAVLEEAGALVEELPPFASRYLSTSGGRLGGTPVRQQLYRIAQGYEETGQALEIEGDGHASEEYIRGIGPGTKGSTYVDLTVRYADGATVRIQTIDTLSDGVTPTKAEADAASRIGAAFPNDKLLIIPKSSR